LVYRLASELQVLLVHPGGPFWARRDTGAWSIPKGEVDAKEPLLDAARREFHEETGSSSPVNSFPCGRYHNRARK
jgi:predicted NUDIX family NTP pyrophosphohydrolase